LTIRYDSPSVAKAKEEFFAAAPALPNFDPQLIESWRRSQMALGRPENVTDVPQVPEEMLDLYLLDLLQAPLNRFAEDLADTGLGLLLADARGQVIQRWSHDHTAIEHLDRLGTVRGAVLAESAVGTNGVGTVLMTGKIVQISGNEHFADFYQDAMCTGSPLRHPINGKLMGVVTLSSKVTPRADLLRPLLKSLTTQLEQHVLELAQPATRRMFDVFLKYSRQHSGGVVAFGPQGALIQNPAAGGLTTEDMTQIHTAVAAAPLDGRLSLDLSTGRTALEFTSLDSGNAVVVIQGHQTPAVRTSSTLRTTSTLQTTSTLHGSSTAGGAPQPLAGRSPEWLAAVHQVAKLRESARPVLIAGEAGVGKVSLALGRPFRPGSPEVLDAAESHLLGDREWLQQLSDRLKLGEFTVIRGIETLDSHAADGLRALLDRTLLDPTRPTGKVFMTVTAAKPDDVNATKRRFAANVVWLAPLRERFSDIAVLWTGFARSAGAGLEPATEAIALLRAYSWPGNTKELKSVIAGLVDGGKRGTVAPADLPAEMQSGKSLSMIERVELDALRNALSEADGNRAKAAEILGLSRATVYRKMKAYRLQLDD